MNATALLIFIYFTYFMINSCHTYSITIIRFIVKWQFGQLITKMIKLSTQYHSMNVYQEEQYVAMLTEHILMVDRRDCKVLFLLHTELNNLSWSKESIDLTFRHIFECYYSIHLNMKNHGIYIVELDYYHQCLACRFLNSYYPQNLYISIKTQLYWIRYRSQYIQYK